MGKIEKAVKVMVCTARDGCQEFIINPTSSTFKRILKLLQETSKRGKRKAG